MALDPEAPPTPRRWVTQEQAAEHLGVTTRTIRTMVADGRLTGYRIGNSRTRLDLNEVDAAMKPYGGAA
ncbi:MAG: excisionase family DNA-binding protein [Mycobacterium sp.]